MVLVLGAGFDSCGRVGVTVFGMCRTMTFGAGLSDFGEGPPGFVEPCSMFSIRLFSTD